MRFTHMERSSTPPFQHAAAARSRTFTALRFLLAAKVKIMVARAPLRQLSACYFAALVLDPDGNNIEAVFRQS
jgi:hypothetical protein